MMKLWIYWNHVCELQSEELYEGRSSQIYTVRGYASLEEAKTMVYVTNHNMITMAMVIFKTYKMADKGEERVLTKILVYSCFIEPFICLFVTMNWEVPWGQGVTILAL